MSSPSTLDEIRDAWEDLDFEKWEDLSLFDVVGTNFADRVTRLGEKAKRVGAPLQKTVARAREAGQKTVQNLEPTFKDKISFVLGVLNITFSALIFGRWPQHMPMFFAAKFLVLLSVRFYLYRAERFHYFMLDLCYFSNLLLFVHVVFLPASRPLFLVAFCLANGPLAWAIITWRNSMVFHSLDKMTSLFIHYSPLMTTFAMRWLDTQHATMMCGLDQSCSDVSVLHLLLPCIAVYLCWQGVYYLVVNVWKARHIEERDYMTSLRWMVKHKSGAYVLLKHFPERFHAMVFMAAQFVYTALTIALIPLFFFSYDAHVIFVLFIYVASVWNGANFYMEVFSRRYIDSVVALSQISQGAAEQHGKSQ